MRIAVGCDHIVVSEKDEVVAYLRSTGHDVVDCGAYNRERTHYPLYGKRVGELVSQGEVDRGVCLCGTGVGITTAANKVSGVRAALVRDLSAAIYARQELDANVIGFGGKIIGMLLLKDILDAFLETEYCPTDANRQVIQQLHSLETYQEDQSSEEFFDTLLERWDRGDYMDVTPYR